VREGPDGGLAPTAEAGWLAGSVKVDMKRPDKAEKCGHGTNIGFNIGFKKAAPAAAAKHVTTKV
jgi:hypothetical protein